MFLIIHYLLIGLAPAGTVAYESRRLFSQNKKAPQGCFLFWLGWRMFYFIIKFCHACCGVRVVISFRCALPQNIPPDCFDPPAAGTVASESRRLFSQNKKAPQGCFLFWLGWRDSNPRVTESKSVALPLGDSPLFFIKRAAQDFLCGCGDPSEIRTPDTLIKSQVLCQLS